MTHAEQPLESREQQTQPDGQPLADQLAAAQAEIEQLKDKYLRSVAEFANYRKRQERDAQQTALRLKAAAFRSVLPVLDDLQLAVKHAPENTPQYNWVEGVLLIERKFIKILEDANIKPIAALGQPFDPNLHEAVLQMPSDEHPAGYVVQEVKTGFVLEDEVLRPTKVIVSAGAPAETPEGDEQ
jgi:molecular chaperone GrpE